MVSQGYLYGPVIRHADREPVWKQSTAPTVALGLLLDDLWLDTTNHLLKRCTATAPVTFVSIEVGTDTIDDTEINWGSGAGQVDADDVPESATKKWAGETGADVTGSHAPQAHAASHVAGDAIQSATAAQAGLATAAQISKLDGIEAAADVTDATNVEAAGAAMVAGDIYSGAHDFGGADSLEVPNGAGGTTVNATGEVTYDSTSGTLNVYDGSAERVVGQPVHILAIPVLAPLDTDDFPFIRIPWNITLKEVDYLCISGTNWVGQIQEGDSNGINGADTQAADSTVTAAGGNAQVTSFSNATIDAGDYLVLKTTSISGSPTIIVITIQFYINP